MCTVNGWVSLSNQSLDFYISEHELQFGMTQVSWVVGTLDSTHLNLLF